MDKQLTNKRGFTLIELVIVLAIAALILAGVLLAVTGAQQSQRDSHRRRASGQIGALLQESAGNNNGNYPGTAGGATTAAFTAQIAQKGIKTPTGGAIAPTYAVAVGACPAWAAADTVTVQIAGRTWKVCYDLESKDTFNATGQ